MKFLHLIVGITVFGSPSIAAAGCFPLAQSSPRYEVASLEFAELTEDMTVGITYLGHSSFMIETRSGYTAVTDYNGVYQPPVTPDIVTMNNAHSTHYTPFPDPKIPHVLRGWNPEGGMAEHNLELDGLRVRNVPTSVHGRTGDQANSNSIFVFEVDDLCVAHLGHLHHVLTPTHLGELGIIDILMVPVGGWTMSRAEMVTVVNQLDPTIVIPMHYHNGGLEGFLSQLQEGREIVIADASQLEFSRFTLPRRSVIVMAPTRFSPPPDP